MRPISLPALAAVVAELAITRPGQVASRWTGRTRSRPGTFADPLVEPVRVRGRSAIRVRAEDHLRAASLRFERGRTDPDSFYDDWLDEEGLRCEVLDPLHPGGTGRIRPVRWDARRDRASREPFVAVPDDVVVILSGPLLLGRGLPIDLSIHLEASAAALRRRTPAADEWTLPAYERYAREVAPAEWADVVVRVDDPRHPALARFPRPL
jgi:hypothetical protein